MSADLSTSRPGWLERLPRRADALCVAASIERSVPIGEWGAAVRQAQDAGFEVDGTHPCAGRTA